MPLMSSSKPHFTCTWQLFLAWWVSNWSIYTQSISKDIFPVSVCVSFTTQRAYRETASLLSPSLRTRIFLLKHITYLHTRIFLLKHITYLHRRIFILKHTTYLHTRIFLLKHITYLHTRIFLLKHITYLHTRIFLLKHITYLHTRIFLLKHITYLQTPHRFTFGEINPFQLILYPRQTSTS
jgi:hypothetical protein